MENSQLHIRRFSAQYLVPAQHPSPERVKDRLDAAVTQQLAPTLSAVFSAWFSDADPSIWLIRRLEVEVAVNAAWEREQLARAITTQIARTLDVELQDGTDRDNVQRFANRAAYLASFLFDVATGVAWSRWYYESFAGLRLLPISAALRTAICDEPQTGHKALGQLANNDVKQVLRALTGQDARRILETMAAHTAMGDEVRCCQAAWAAWLSIAAEVSSVTDEWQQVLYVYLTASRETEEAGGLHLRRAALALVRLAQRLAGASSAQYHRLLNALTGGNVSSLYVAAGAADAEALLPLLHCPPVWVREVAHVLLAHSPGQATPAIVTPPGRRDTAFGGVFLLLPLLDDLPLVEATCHWPHADEAAAISLVRLLLLVKCCGQEQAQRAFYDPLWRDVLLIPPAISQAVLRDWHSGVTSTHLQTFLDVLADWQHSHGAIGGEKQVLAVSYFRGRPLAVLIDGMRGLWLLLRSQSRRRPLRVNATLHDRLVRLTQNNGLLVCDSALFPSLRAAFPALQLVHAGDHAMEARPDEDYQLSEILARLDKLPDELSYLALPASFGLARSFDLTLSIAAQHLLRGFAWRLPGFSRSNLPYLHANFLAYTGSVEEEPARRVVRLGRPPLHLVLHMTGIMRTSYRVSWLDERPFVLFPEE